jgi:PST family polysaccharide transporter
MTSIHRDGLRRKTVRSAGVTILSGGLALGIQIIATVVLARLISPRDFGLVAMVTTISLLPSNFGLNGFTEAIVQREQLTHAQASNLFWLSLGGGVLLTIAFAASGTLLMRFYREPLVAPVAVGLSATILLTSISVVHLALLKRAMRFSLVAGNDITARAVSVAVSIVLAKAGWGYWALVAGTCALPMSAMVGCFALCQWIPGRPRRAAGTGDMVRFAMHTYGRFGVNYFARNADNLLVGWRFGAGSLGFYKKAYDLFALPAGQLVSSTTLVAISALSRLKDDRAAFQRYLTGALTVMAFIGMGLSGLLTLTGKDIVRLLLGPKWGTAGQIFTLFAPGIGAMILYGTHGWIHLSIGRADRWLRWGIVEWSVTILFFLLALHWGPQGIAVAWCASLWLLLLPAMWYAGKPIGLGAGCMIAATWRYVAAALAAGVLSRLGLKQMTLPTLQGDALASVERVATVTVLYGFFYLACVVSVHGSFGPLRLLRTLIQDLLSARRTNRIPDPISAGSWELP